MIETAAAHPLPHGSGLTLTGTSYCARIAREKDIDTLTQTFLENTVRFFGIIKGFGHPKHHAPDVRRGENELRGIYLTLSSLFMYDDNTSL
ncbi:MAG: hypothetical protein J6M90_05665 [Oscillospiraceae bacterium]|nr:hypothetical protein [Oscillospiraceae bacterium]